MRNFFAHTDETRAELLKSISCSSVEELFSKIPQEAKTKSLNLENALSEMQAQKAVK